MNYVFIDEVQKVIEFQKACDSLYIKRNVDLYITGSNSYMLSGELATLLSGRYVEIKMLPLSFKEYISYVGETDISKKYVDYIINSSFPYTLMLNTSKEIRMYLDNHPEVSNYCILDDDYDMEYFAIDTDELSLKQTNEIIEKLEIEGSTPTIVIVKDGDVVDTSVGYKDGRALVQFFVDNKILPKDAEYSAEKYITFIDYNKYKSLIRSDDTHIIVVGQTSCSHCIAIKPALKHSLHRFRFRYIEIIQSFYIVKTPFYKT